MSKRDFGTRSERTIFLDSRASQNLAGESRSPGSRQPRTLEHKFLLLQWRVHVQADGGGEWGEGVGR